MTEQTRRILNDLAWAYMAGSGTVVYASIWWRLLYTPPQDITASWVRAMRKFGNE